MWNPGSGDVPHEIAALLEDEEFISDDEEYIEEYEFEPHVNMASEMNELNVSNTYKYTNR